MTVLDQVSDFIKRHSPQPVCDKCITEGLHLTVPQHANHKTLELAKMRGFKRIKVRCCLCKNEKRSISFGA